MTTFTLPAGPVHELPEDLQRALLADEGASFAWQDITPLARNEWICWVLSVKQQQTRDKRVAQAVDMLTQGKRRPCCWPGCAHRERTGS